MPKPHLALFAALLLALGVQRFSGSIDPYHLDVLIGIGINVILAVSLNLVNGYTGQFSLGHAGFMAVGAYMSAAVTMGLTLPVAELSTIVTPVPDDATAWATVKQLVGQRLQWVIAGLYDLFAQGVNFVIAKVHALPAIPQFVLAATIGGGFAAIAGYLIGKPSLRLKGDYLALVTLGFGEIIRVIFQNVEVLGGALGLNGIPPHTNIFWVIAFVALTVFVITCLVNSTYGRGFLATHDDEIASEAVGLDTTRYKITAFVVGAFFAGIAGSLYGHFKLTITPTGFDFTRSIEIVVMVILGGMGNTLGVILAAILLTLLPEVLRPIAEFRMIIYSLLLVVLMLARPQGLFNFKLRLGKKKTNAPAAPTT